MPGTEVGDLSDRAQDVLKLLIEHYIREGQPIGSRTLAKGSALQLSAASIRNVMADLEDMGLVSSPHTSAGRIPTVQGYRLFVDSLLTVRRLQGEEVGEFRRSSGSMRTRTVSSRPLPSSSRSSPTLRGSS